MSVIEVEWLSPDGVGGARHGRGSIRVPGTIPGDRVEVAEQSRNGVTVTAAMTALVTPSPHRRLPPCRFDDRCGGCDLSVLKPEARPSVLGRVAQRALELPSLPTFVGSPNPHAHRARVKFAIRDEKIGFLAERSHAIVDVDGCLAARSEVDDGLRRVRALPTLAGLSAVEVRSNGERVVFAFEGDKTLPDATFQAICTLGDVALGGRRIAGDPTLLLKVAGVVLQASPGSFYQVNLEVDELLATYVRDTVVGWSAERVVDLYGGIGNLGLPIAVSGVPVVSVEMAGASAADGAAAARRLGAPWRGVNADVGRWDPSREAFDVAVLDPPRAGAPGVVERVIRNRPRGIVYVSCNVSAAARDLRPALAAGYRIDDVRVYDMFPDTRHFETVITLRR
jgi:23S rRNA (uracil1939-C5)-methyltransferase